MRFGAREKIGLVAGPQGVRFLLFAGAPIREPVAWHGPIVMNTRKELCQYFADLRHNTFIAPQDHL